MKRADEGDFETLVRQHADTVWRFARSMVRDDHAAEEIVQETFLKAFRSRDSYRGDSSVTTWLYTICRRNVLDHARRATAVVVPLDVEVHAGPAADWSSDDRLTINAAIDALPADEREAFVLAAVLGYSRDEAAELVGIPASTMRSRVARARTRLVAALTPEDDA